MIRQICNSMTKTPYFSSFVERPTQKIVFPCFSNTLWRNHSSIGARYFSSRAQSQEWTKSGAIFQATFPHRLSSSRSFSTSRDKESAHLLSPKIDIVFKDFFGDAGSKEILESFINLFLDLHGNDEIEIEEFLDPRKMRIELGKPTTFVDLSVKTKSGERYIIEMQTYNHEGFDKRLLYYLGKDYTEQLAYEMEKFKEEKQERTKKHQISWHTLLKVHVIAITSYGILKSDDIVETFRFQPQKSEKNGHLLDQWRATIIDLTNFTTRSFEKLKSDEDYWLFLMKNADKLSSQQVEVMKKQNPFLQRALERLELISSDPEKKKEYEQSINTIRDWDAVLEYADKTGREEGRDEGRVEARVEIAKKMLELEIPIEKIIKSTGLTHKEVEELQKKLS